MGTDLHKREVFCLSSSAENGSRFGFRETRCPLRVFPGFPRQSVND